VRRRLDVEMVRRGLSATRTEATQAIESGKVTVSGRPVEKAAMLVLPQEPIIMAPPVRRFVSRAGEKLDGALTAFGIEVADTLALDAGASTGGFTDCLLSRRARHVVAVDVGYGQLDWRLREDPRVTVLERTNVRELRAAQLPYRPNLITADLSFISLGMVLPALVESAAETATFLLLVKPQFEASRGQAPGGVVTDPTVWTTTLGSVARAAAQQGLAVAGVMASPIRGLEAGNAEFFLHARHSGNGAGAGEDDEGRLGGWIAEAVRQAQGQAEADGERA
jgi:23S rRNA (cytidine1920-2'-O)/16S rRNA (cytidine1409-2'-O)-methyltransferase